MFCCTISSGSEMEMETNKCIVDSTHRSHYNNGSQFTGFMVCAMPNEVENNKHRINYSHDDHLRACESVKQDKRYKIMDFNTANTIRKLRWNRWGKQGGRTTKPQCRNPSSLIYIKPTNKYSNLTEHNLDQSIKITLTNIQSVKSKGVLLHDHILHNKTDICIMTETWLQDRDSDEIWKDMTYLKKNLNKL